MMRFAQVGLFGEIITSADIGVDMNKVHTLYWHMFGWGTGCGLAGWTGTIAFGRLKDRQLNRWSAYYARTALSQGRLA
jgi:hypothetical protein